MPRKPSPPIRKLIIIEDGLLSSMASNKQFLSEFPFLKGLQQYAQGRQPGCGTCGGAAKVNAAKAVVFTAAKQTLAQMGDSKRRKLKQLLNAEKVRVTYKSGSKIVQHTF